jgi:hypothetical protein
MKLTEEQQKHRRSRNLALLGVLVGLVVLFYVITIVRWGVA